MAVVQAPQQDVRASCRPDEHDGDDPGSASGAPVLRSDRAAAPPPPPSLVPPLRGGSSELRGGPSDGDAAQSAPGQRDGGAVEGLAAEGDAKGEASAGSGESGSRGARQGGGAPAEGEAGEEEEPVVRRGRRLLSMLSGSGRLPSASLPLLSSGNSCSRSGSAGSPGARGEAAAPPFFSAGAAEPKPGCTCGPPRLGAPPPEGLQGGVRGAPARAARPDLKRPSGGKAKLGAPGGFWLAFPDGALERQFTRYLAAQQLQARPLPGLGWPGLGCLHVAPTCRTCVLIGLRMGLFCVQLMACSVCSSCAAGSPCMCPNKLLLRWWVC